MAWKIRFCSGLNKGVEVPLSEGRLVIGSDPAEADLVVVDAGVAPVHLVLGVSAQHVLIVEWAVGNTATQDGEPVAAGSELQVFLAQACGPLQWAFCEQDGHFDQAMPVLATVSGKRAKGSLSKHWLGMAMAGCAVLVIALLVIIEPWAVSTEPERTQTSETNVRTYLQQQHLVDVVIGTPQPGIGVELKGYVQSNKERVDLQQFMEASGIAYRLDVRSQEDIRKEVDFILCRLGYKGTHSVDGNRLGWVRLVGEDVQDPVRWQQTLQTLKNDVQGLQGVETTPMPVLTPLKKLQQLLESAGLASQLTIKDSGNWIELSGALNDQQLEDFQNVQRQYSAAFTAPPELRLKNSAVKKKAVSVQFPIRAVAIGRVPYVVLSDNRRYPVGGFTPSGVLVEDIQFHQVTVSKQGQTFIFDLRGGANDER